MLLQPLAPLATTARTQVLNQKSAQSISTALKAVKLQFNALQEPLLNLLAQCQILNVTPLQVSAPLVITVSLALIRKLLALPRSTVLKVAQSQLPVLKTHTLPTQVLLMQESAFLSRMDLTTLAVLLLKNQLFKAAN